MLYALTFKLHDANWLLNSKAAASLVDAMRLYPENPDIVTTVCTTLWRCVAAEKGLSALSARALSAMVGTPGLRQTVVGPLQMAILSSGGIKLLKMVIKENKDHPQLQKFLRSFVAFLA